jgi:hypothetical protein
MNYESLQVNFSGRKVSKKVEESEFGAALLAVA